MVYGLHINSGIIRVNTHLAAAAACVPGANSRQQDFACAVPRTGRIEHILKEPMVAQCCRLSMGERMPSQQCAAIVLMLSS